jgi:MFS family permease
MNYDSQNIGIIAAIYPTVWGFGQLFTGRMSDIYSKRKCCLECYCRVIMILFRLHRNSINCISAVLGLGTISIPYFFYPYCEATTPHQRAESIGV